VSGHSKWHNIQRRKGKQDSARGQLFTRLSRDIYQAAKELGGNPETNFRLKIAIERAKQNNLPADSITRTIAKATGSVQGVTYEEILYEGYAPGGVAVMIEIVTDNRNRTAADVRHVFNKRKGNLGETGCVGWMFERVGNLSIAKETCTRTFDDLLMAVLEAGADDLREMDDAYILTTTAEAFRNVRSALEDAGFLLDEADITYEATNTVEVNGQAADELFELIEALEALDDVQTVHTNAVFQDN